MNSKTATLLRGNGAPLLSNERHEEPGLEPGASLDPTRGATMAILTAEVRALLESDALAHLVTLNPDGSPQVSCVWVAVDGEEILTGHMARRQKVRNVERDERVSLSIEAQGVNNLGLREYLVVHGRARVQEGGAAALLQELAHVYMGPDVVFPPPGSDAPGYVLRITPERLSGVGPWTNS